MNLGWVAGRAGAGLHRDAGGAVMINHIEKNGTRCGACWGCADADDPSRPAGRLVSTRQRRMVVDGVEDGPLRRLC